MSRIPRIGDRVRFTAAFLRSTGQYTGPDEPTAWGPFARGNIERVLGPDYIVRVLWDNGVSTAVNAGNLETCR